MPAQAFQAAVFQALDNAEPFQRLEKMQGGTWTEAKVEELLKLAGSPAGPEQLLMQAKNDAVAALSGDYSDVEPSDLQTGSDLHLAVLDHLIKTEALKMLRKAQRQAPAADPQSHKSPGRARSH